jgi:hypothetical protein
MKLASEASKQADYSLLVTALFIATFKQKKGVIDILNLIYGKQKKGQNGYAFSFLLSSISLDWKKGSGRPLSSSLDLVLALA